MNRTGLVIALAIAAIVGVVFGVDPKLDLALSAPFFDPNHLGFWVRLDPIANGLRASPLRLLLHPRRLPSWASSCCRAGPC